MPRCAPGHCRYNTMTGICIFCSESCNHLWTAENDKTYCRHCKLSWDTYLASKVTTRCECGSDTCGSPKHSHWCPKFTGD